MKTIKNLLWILLPFIGLLMLQPYLRFQQFLSPGDHGLLLYASEQALKGSLPYYDYHWFYGPLMPYYFALFFKVFGIGIKSVLLGVVVAKLLCGLAVYLIFTLFASPFLGFISAIWFWVYYPGFFYTYNHIGGIALLLFSYATLIAYIKNPSLKKVSIGFFFLFLLSFVKINIGFGSIAAYTLSLFIINRTYHRKAALVYGVGLLGLPLIVLAIHALYLHKLPFYEIAQCFQYFQNDAYADSYPGLLRTLVSLVKIHLAQIRSSWEQLAFGATVLVGLISICYQLYKRKLDGRQRQEMLLIFCSLGLFYAANSHEYLLSAIPYRLPWATPFSMAAAFVVVWYGTGIVRKSLRQLLFLSILLVAIIVYSNSLLSIKTFLSPAHFIPLKRARIFTYNSPDWINTVSQTTFFINANVKKDEPLLSFPYDPLYNFLTAHPSPTRQLVFFKFQNIPPEQEKTIIQELETSHVRWLVSSNRILSKEAGLGTFGETHCPLLAQYIKNNFELQAEYGDWVNPGGWAWTHGTRILKRKEK